MKKRILIALLVMLALAATASVAWADPVVWNVYPDGSIQNTIDGATTGDTIYVHEGTYNQSIIIKSKDLSTDSSWPCDYPTNIIMLRSWRCHPGLQQRGND